MKYIIITKKHLSVICCSIIGLIIAVVCSIGVLANSDKKLPIYCVDCEDKKIALSFDAAWGNSQLRQYAN